MLAGCSPALLSQRHRFTFKLEEDMSTQRLDLPCGGFSRKDAPRVALSLEKLAETRTSCSFRQSTVAPSSSSIIARTASWDGVEEVGTWHRGKSLKRFYDQSSSEEDSTRFDRAKKKRTGGGALLVGGGSEHLWLPHSIAETSLVEEEKVYFIPNAAFISNALLGGSFAAEVVNSGERDTGTSEGTHGRTKSDSSSSSDTRSSSQKLFEESSENGTQSQSQIPRAYGVARPAVVREEDTQLEHQGFELVSLLLSCVESISSSNHTAINYFLARLGELASPTSSPTHRIAAYFTEALAIRVVRLWPNIFSVAPPRELTDHTNDDDDATAFRLLNHVNPIPKFIHFTLNERLLRAFEGNDRVHIIDFDIKQGLQWPGLLQSLASRHNPPSHVRITGIGESKQDLQDTGTRLAGLAEALNLPFEFHPVVDRLEDVRLWMLHVKERECVAVNCVLQLHKTLYDESGSVLRDFLSLVRSTNPSIVLVAEEEAQNNVTHWEARFANSLRYYSAIFDSMDASLQLDSLARIKIEEMFARRIRNIVAYEGFERVERHEVFGKWRGLMENGGFHNVGIGEREALQSKMLLRMYSCTNFSIEKQGEGGAGLTLRWLDQPLYTVSAWSPSEIAGCFSTSRQVDEPLQSV